MKNPLGRCTVTNATTMTPMPAAAANGTSRPTRSAAPAASSMYELTAACTCAGRSPMPANQRVVPARPPGPKPWFQPCMISVTPSAMRSISAAVSMSLMRTSNTYHRRFFPRLVRRSLVLPRRPPAGQCRVEHQSCQKQRDRDDTVEPPVMTRCRHDEHREGQMKEAHPSPSTGGRRIDPERHDGCPADVDGRHRGELVGHAGADGPVDAEAEAVREVDEMEIVDEPRRRDTDEPDHQTAGRHGDE